MQSNYPSNKYNIDEILYLVHGTKIAKCEVKEIIVYQSKETTTVKYNVRPYGMEKFVAIAEENLYTTLEEAKVTMITTLEEGFQDTIENLKKITEETFNALENNLIKKEQ